MRYELTATVDQAQNHRHYRTQDLHTQRGPIGKRTAQTLEYIRQLATDDNGATLAGLCERLAECYSVTLSASSMCCALKQLNLPRKKTLHAIERDSEVNQQARRQYQASVQAIQAEDLAFYPMRVAPGQD